MSADSGREVVRRVAFDLDGVIASRDTMAFLIQRQLVSHPGRAIVGALPAAAWMVLRGFPAARILLSRVLGCVALSGMSITQYENLALQVGGELGRDPGWTIAAGLASIKQHLLDGDDVVVTTGTEFLLARAFLDRSGLQDVDLIATTVRFDRAFARYENHNLGQQKVHNLDGRGIDLFYTDSDLDLPLAMFSRRTILVNPNARQERLFRARVENLTIVRWG